MSVVPPAVRAAEPAFPSDSAALGAPYFTRALIVVLLLIFGAELFLNLAPDSNSLGPTPQTFYLIGGISRSAVFGLGQWWRIFTAPLLHLNLSHVLFNCLGLFLVGRLLEPRIGWQWMSAVFVVSAAGGALASMTLNPPDVVSVGASGGIVGVFAAALGVASRLPPDRSRRSLIRWAAYGLVSSVAPLFLSTGHNGSTTSIQFGVHVGGGGVDYAAHLGGAIAGGLLSMLLLRLWSPKAMRPSGSRVAAAITGAYFAIAALSIVAINTFYNEYLQLDLDTAHATTAYFASNAGQLIHQYPRDPRVLYGEGISLLRKGDRAGAEANIRAGLAETGILRDFLPSIQPILEAELAGLLYDRNKIDEAKAVVAPACPALPAQMLTTLQKGGLCPANIVAAANVGTPPASHDAASYSADTRPAPNAGIVDLSGAPPAARPKDTNDASARLSDALAKLRSGNAKAAQAELQTAFAGIEDTRATSANPVVVNNMQALLAVTIYVSGDDTGARNLAAPVCAFETQGLYAKLLKDDKLC